MFDCVHDSNCSVGQPSRRHALLSGAIECLVLTSSMLIMFTMTQPVPAEFDEADWAGVFSDVHAGQCRSMGVCHRWAAVHHDGAAASVMRSPIVMGGLGAALGGRALGTRIRAQVSGAQRLSRAAHRAVG